MKTNVDDLVDGATAAAEASLKGLGEPDRMWRFWSAVSGGSW